MISVEFFHQYIWTAEVERRFIDAVGGPPEEGVSASQLPDEVSQIGCEIADEWARYAVDLQKRIGILNKTDDVEYCVLHDDYFNSPKLNTWSALVDVHWPELAIAAVRKEGVEDLKVVRESDLVPAGIELLGSLELVSDFGAGTIKGTGLDEDSSALWISNGASGDPKRAVNEGDRWERLGVDFAPRFVSTDDGDFSQKILGQHSLRVEYEIFENQRNPRTPMSCALLAAAWQLSRLGLLPHGLEKVIGVASHNLSYLPPDFLGIETVVQMIVEMYKPHKSFSTDVARLDELGGSRGVISRISYVIAS